MPISGQSNGTSSTFGNLRDKSTVLRLFKGKVFMDSIKATIVENKIKAKLYTIKAYLSDEPALLAKGIITGFSNGVSTTFGLLTGKGIIAGFSNSLSTTFGNLTAQLPEFEPETDTLVVRFDTAPTSALKDLIDVTIKGLKDDGVFVEGDGLYVRGVHTSISACQNWIKNAHNSTLNNAPTFTAKQGFKGNGTTQSINNNYTPSTDAVKLATNSMSVFFMQNVLATSTARSPFGAYKNTVPRGRIYMLQYPAGTNERGYIFATGYNNDVDLAVNQSLGYVKIGDNIQAYINGLPVGAPAAITTDAALPPLSMHELASNQDAVIGSFSNAQLGWSFYGAALNDAKALALHTRMAYFFANVGGTF